MERWRKLGNELKLLDRFAMDLICEYSDMLDSRTTAKLSKAHDYILQHRSMCEDRMFLTTDCDDTKVFYGSNSPEIVRALQAVRSIFDEGR